MAQQVIGIGTTANDGTGDPVRTAFSKSKANFAELYGQTVNAGLVYGAVADGSTSVNSVISQAITDGVKTLVFDQGSSFYNITASVSIPSGFSIIAGKGRPQFKITSAATSRAFAFTGATDSHLIGIALDGNYTVTPTDVSIVINSSSSKCSIEDCVFTNLAGASIGGIAISGGATRNIIRNCQFDNCEGTAISISGAHQNIIADNQIRTYGIAGGWGVGIQSAALRNLVIGNHIVGTGASPVGECIVTQYDCTYTRVIGNHCELAGDDGISISGNYCTVQGNICLGAANAGIGVWGSNNTITGNILKNNAAAGLTNYWSGIWVQSNYGSTGSFNVISGNSFDDDQAVPTQNYGVRLHGSGYTAWAAGQAISNLSDFTQLWRVNGLNIYQAQNTGTTGATPPTHTTGTVSDGAVSWKYITSFTTAVGTLWNTVSDNIVQRSAIASYFDADNWQHNVLFSSTTTSMTITADGLVRARPL